MTKPLKIICQNCFCIFRDYEATNGCLSPQIDVKMCPQRLLYHRIAAKMKSIKTGNEGKSLWLKETRNFKREFLTRVREG